jgi:hypothetical protein
VVEVDARFRPRVEAESVGSPLRADGQKRPDGEDASLPCLAATNALELAELFERIDADVRVGADAQRDASVGRPREREEAVSEVRLRRRAHADARPGVTEQIELGPVCVRRVHDRRSLAQAAFAREQLDRAEAVLGRALLDLARLLVGVDVQREVVVDRVPAELAQPVGRAGADGVGGDGHAHPVGAEGLQLAEVVPY